MDLGVREFVFLLRKDSGLTRAIVVVPSARIWTLTAALSF